MSDQTIGEALGSSEALNLGLMGISDPLKERVSRIYGSVVLSLDVRSAQNIVAEGRVRYLALGIILRTEALANSTPVKPYLRVDRENDWGLSQEQLTAAGDCAIRRPVRYSHPDGQVLAAPQPSECVADVLAIDLGVTTAPDLTLVTKSIAA